MFVFTYGNSGTVLLLGAISFHITLVGASLKPQKKQSLQEEGHPETERYGLYAGNNVFPNPCSFSKVLSCLLGHVRVHR